MTEIKTKKFRPRTFLKKLGIENADLESVHIIIASLSYSGEMVEVDYSPREKTPRSKEERKTK